MSVIAFNVFSKSIISKVCFPEGNKTSWEFIPWIHKYKLRNQFYLINVNNSWKKSTKERKELTPTHKNGHILNYLISKLTNIYIAKIVIRPNLSVVINEKLCKSLTAIWQTVGSRVTRKIVISTVFERGSTKPIRQATGGAKFSCYTVQTVL
jgi:hypothetical protein